MITNPDIFPYIKGIHLKKLPLKDIECTEQKPFIVLVDKIIATTKDEDYSENPAKQAKIKKYERQIDQMVYKLYDLTNKETKIVESFNEQRRKDKRFQTLKKRDMIN